MKSIFLTLAPAIGALALCGCNKEDNKMTSGSQMAETMFKARYPEATATQWEKKGDYWVVDFLKDESGSRLA
ncbi:MAG: hypothetical protein LBV26_04295 [Bacteroidales bacterium]|nr:hypothetical protein [Bacteroidales bacterium]